MREKEGWGLEGGFERVEEGGGGGGRGWEGGFESE